ncbi:MAG: hypothetical protein RR386_00920 [Bacteroidaceae bacterium]
MKLKTILLISLITLSAAVSSQDNNQIPMMTLTESRPVHRPPFSPEEFMKRQEAFIIKEAGLTPTEAQFLFPLFHQSKQKQREISRQIQSLVKKGKEKDLTENEYLSILRTIDKLQMNKLKIEQSYHEKYRKMLSNKKILAIVSANARFDRRMLKQMFRHDDHKRKNDKRN